ncbi:MAG: hypothetical protein ACTSSH_00030 [Candidatus Heimdallarchaeota archaeon]
MPDTDRQLPVFVVDIHGNIVQVALASNQIDGSQKTKITDGTNELYIWDSGGITSVRAVHYRIKESKEFYANYCWADIADTNSVYFLIKAGDKTPHGNIGIMTSGKANLFLYETPTITGDGTAVTPYCLNRETDASPDATFFRDPTIGADGTELECALLGAAGKFSAVGGELSGAYWWFDHNKNYIVKVTNTSGGAIDIAIGYGFHEHLAV